MHRPETLQSLIEANLPIYRVHIGKVDDGNIPIYLYCDTPQGVIAIEHRLEWVALSQDIEPIAKDIASSSELVLIEKRKQDLIKQSHK